MALDTGSRFEQVSSKKKSTNPNASTTMAYNKETRQWEKKISDKKNDTAKSPNTGSGKSAMTSNSTDSKTAKGKAEQEKNKQEYYTLSGNLKVLPNAVTVNIQCGQTLELKNLGSYLSGKYYVAGVTRTIDSNGYSQECEVYNPNFREKFKVKKVTAAEKPKSVSSNSKSSASTQKKQSVKKAPSLLMKKAASVDLMSVSLQSAGSSNTSNAAGTKTENATDNENVRTYTIASPSDTLWTIARRFYNDSSKWKNLYLLSTGETPDPLDLKVGMQIVIP